MKSLAALWLPLCVGMVFATSARGEEAAQTDWSGGGGMSGPVSQWTDRFASSRTIDWAPPSGGLTLLSAWPSPHDVTSTFGEPAGVAAADIDGDQDLDVIGVAYQGDEVAWWENDGSGSGWIQHTIATGFAGACALDPCDLDGDGDIDVAATAEGAGMVAWWENDGSGGGWALHVVTAAVDAPYSVCAADFDGDQDLDLCGAIFSQGDILWWENADGLGTDWIPHGVDLMFSGAWWAVAADVDHDDDVDVLGAALALGDICWWENDGAGGGWAKHFIDASFPMALCVRAADMDGDEDLDAVGASNSGALAWWANDGTGDAWTKHPIDSGLGGPFSVRVADLDRDGDQDVISNERSGDRVMWYENVDGGGSVWLERSVDETSDGPNDVLAADLDGDGCPNVVATFSWDNCIRWYEPTDAYAASGELDSAMLDIGSQAGAWGDIDWTCVAPPYTSLRVDVRASNDLADLGPWIEVAASGDDLSGYVPDGARYFQYRVSLATTDSAATPNLLEIRIGWDPTGGAVEEERGQSALPWCTAIRNPSRSEAAAIRFHVPRACRVDLALYDIAGREQVALAEGMYAQGTYSVAVEGLPRGVYLYRMSAGGSQSSGKLVLQ